MRYRTGNYTVCRRVSAFFSPEILVKGLSDPNAMQYKICRTVQYSAMQYNTMQYSIVQFSTRQYITEHCNTIQCTTGR